MNRGKAEWLTRAKSDKKDLISYLHHNTLLKENDFPLKT